MSDSHMITASEFPGGPPQGLSMPFRLRWSKTHPPADPSVSYIGKTVLVTGANTGLGFEAAVKYAALGAETLILGVRSIPQGDEARARIAARTGRGTEAILVLAVDLSDFASVAAFARTLGEVAPRLDVALLNAGLGNPSYEASPAGWEMAVQVNVLSTALMAVLLLPILQSTTAAVGPAPHLTFVNSHGHGIVPQDSPLVDGSLLRTANETTNWDAAKSYSLVKLLGIAVMKGLAGQTAGEAGPRVIVNAVCPDLCRTDLGRKWDGIGSRIGKAIFYALFARTAEQGARSLVSATALGPESHGRFWHHDTLFPLGELAQDEALMRKTWAEIVEVITQDQPEVRQLVGNVV